MVSVWYGLAMYVVMVRRSTYVFPHVLVNIIK